MVDHVILSLRQYLVPNLALLGTVCALVGGLLLLLHLFERQSSRFVAHRLGWRGVFVTGWLGVPLHELSHLVTALAFGHRVLAWRLFDPDPSSGTLGYVRHAYSKRSAWQLLGTAVIAVAPALAGSAVLGALLMGPLPSWRLAHADLAHAVPVGSAALIAKAALHGFSALIHAAWAHRTPWLPVRGYLAICVASHMAPSRSDFKGALPGGLVWSGLLLCAACAASIGRISLAPLQLAPMVLAICVLLAASFQGLYCGLLEVFARLLRRRSPRAIIERG